MCGIFGIISRYSTTEKQRDFIDSCLQAGQVRGIHGTGLMISDWKGDVHHYAAAITGTEMVKRLDIDNVLPQYRSAKTIIGHNRHATMGEHTDENCHPFAFDHIVGVHNGTIGDNVMNYVDPDKSHDVDSARLYAALSKADDPLEVLQKVWGGAYSLVWHDTEKGQLHLARNSLRPMCIAVTHDALYLASEMGMLTWLLARHDLGPFKDEPITVAETDTNTLYTIDLSDLSQVTAEPYKVEAAPKVERKKETVPERTQAKFDKPRQAAKRDDDGEAPYEHRSSKYYRHIGDLERDYPKLKHLCDYISNNLMVVAGEIYERGYIQACVENPESLVGADFCSVSGYLTDEIGRKEASWSVLARVVGSKTGLAPMRNQLPCESDTEGEVIYPLFEVNVVGYEVRPTGEVIAICSPILPISKPELFVPQEDGNEGVWAGYACSEDYLTEMSDDQIMGLWLELASLEGESEEVKAN